MVDFNSKENWPQQPAKAKSARPVLSIIPDYEEAKAACLKGIATPLDEYVYNGPSEREYYGEHSIKVIEWLLDLIRKYEASSDTKAGAIKVSDFVQIKPGPLSSVHFGTSLFKDGKPIGKILSADRVGDVVTGKVKIDYDMSLASDYRKAHDDHSASVQYKNPPELPRRMWVNQPSTFQPYHQFHGMRVIAIPEYGNIMRVYPVEGDTISMQMNSLALSEGWPTPKQEVNEYAEVSSAAWASIYDFLKDGNQALNDETLDKLFKNVAESIAIVANVPVHMLLGPALKK